MSQHLLVAFLFLMALWEAGAVLGHVGLSGAWGPSQLTHLIGLSGGCSGVLWFTSPHILHLGSALQVSGLCMPQHFLHCGGRIPLAVGYSTFNRVPMITTVLGVCFTLSSLKVSRMDAVM